jgi:uncharacterized protein (TIGR02001 family)
MRSAQRNLSFAALPLLAGLLATAAPAHAADAAPLESDAAGHTSDAVASPWSATVTAATQYVSRGIRQSWGHPVLQAGVDYGNPQGWNAGAWASSIDDRFVENGSVELDLYAGYSGSAGPVGYNATLTWFRYPGAQVSATRTSYDYGELQGGLGWKSLYAKYNYTFSRDFFGIENARGTGYLDIGANHELGETFTLQLHAGQGRVAGAGNGIWDWRDLRVGLAKKFTGGWVAAVNYTRAIGATGAYDRYTTGVARAGGRPAVSNVARGAAVLSLTRTF